MYSIGRHRQKRQAPTSQKKTLEPDGSFRGYGSTRGAARAPREKDHQFEVLHHTRFGGCSYLANCGRLAGLRASPGMAASDAIDDHRIGYCPDGEDSVPRL